MNNPSYYYQYQPQAEYELHQPRMLYQRKQSCSSSGSSSQPPGHSSREEWEIVNQAFVQSHKHKLNNLSPDHPSRSSSLSSDQQKDRIILNPDRSLKMEKSYKKTPQTHLKNKSLSSPGNKASLQSISKKPQHKISHTNDKMNPKGKVQKVRKQKIQKEKKISNGSLSTNHTKIKAKQPKISKKMLQQKQLQKSTVSQQSNEFLVLGQELYNYEDMSKIQTKGFLPSKHNLFEKETNKKAAFSYYENESASHAPINPVSPHLNSFVIYDETKLNKKVQKTIAKIQKYMMGFLQAEAFQQAKEQALENTQALPLEAKLELYHSLMNDIQLLKLLQSQTKEKQIETIDEVIKLSIDKVQRKSQRLIKQYREEQSLISKWKNSKLHQLSTARKILQKLVEDEKKQFQNSKWEGSESGSSLRSQIDGFDDQNDPILVLQKQLQSVMNQQYYPQLKRQTINLRRVINQLLKNEQFPLPKQQTESEVTQRAKMQDTKNYFTPNGVLWFFQRFFSFVMARPNYVEELVEKLNEGYGFDIETKKKMARTNDLQKWYEFMGSEQTVNHKPLFEAEVFREFEQTVIKTDPQIGQQMFTWMHYFNLAIIDCFNQQFHRFRPFFPSGQPVTHLQRPGKYMQINPESMLYFFEKCKFHVYTNYITFFAGLILPEGHEETKQTRKYSLGKEVKAVNQELLYHWDSYRSLETVAKMAALQQLYQSVEAQLYAQVAKEILLKSMKERLSF